MSVRLAFDRLGVKSSSKTPLVFLHGLFGNKSNSRTVSRWLSKDRESYLVDLRCHGDSPAMTPFNYHTLAMDVGKLIEDEIKEPVIIIGHSMGGRTGMALSLERKDLVKGLISVDASPSNRPIGHSPFGTYLRVYNEMNGKKFKSLKECDEYLSKFEKNKAVRQFLLTNMKPNESEDGSSGSDKYYKCRLPINILRRGIDAVGEWPYENVRYNGPTLFIRGTESPYISDEMIPTIGKYFPSFTMEDIQCGHWVMGEKPQEFTERVQQWLNMKDF